jgi:hypothetical protein
MEKVTSEKYLKVLIELIDARAILLMTELMNYLAGTKDFSLALNMKEFLDEKMKDA